MLEAFATGTLFGARTGTDAPSILALHGWGRSHRDFDGVFGAPPPLAAFAVDLPGFGATPPPLSAWGTEQYARCLEAILPQMNKRIVVVGHSFGGRVALALAAAHPDIVRALVLTGVPLLRGSQRRAALGYRLIKRANQIGLLGDERLEVARKRYGSADYRAADGVMREVFVKVVAESYEELIARVHCPVSLLWGALDADVPPTIAERARPLFATATLEIVEGCGHLIPTQAPEALRRVIDGSIR